MSTHTFFLKKYFDLRSECVLTWRHFSIYDITVTHILTSDRNIFSNQKYVSTSPSPCAHFGERSLFLSCIRRSNRIKRQVPQFFVRQERYGITFLRSSKAGQRNEEKYAKYSKATTTRQYFALGGSAADWRYDLQHRYVRFTDADLQQRTNSLLELRTLPDDSLVNIFLNAWRWRCFSWLAASWYAGLRGR